jgi:CubicO group peptidase (beta-lactamase class C family)
MPPRRPFLLGLFFYVAACANGGAGGAGARAGSARLSPGATPSPSGTDRTTVVTVDADTPMTTPSGSTYIAPKGWTVTAENGVILLEDPYLEVSVRFVERKESEGAAAIAAAWKQAEPSFARTVLLTTPRPGRDGSDASITVLYETKVFEAVRAWATAARKGDTWFVTLLEGTNEGWGRRGAQASVAQGSFRAKGVVEESFAGKRAHVLDAERLDKFEAFIEDSRKISQIPGLAVAVVQGARVVLEKGFGVKELGKKDPVTPNTMFRIASMTKPLTSLMMAALVDEGKFTWDTNVTTILPRFALGYAELTKKLTMRNILCACTGIPYNNLGIYFERISAETMLERMKELKPSTGYGETYQYSNAMIAAAGYVAAHAANPKQPIAVAYEEAMQAKVFGPLGMKHTTFDPKVVARSDHASPHNRNTRFEVELTPTDAAAGIAAMNPAGGAWSTVHDFSQVLLLELVKGRMPDGTRVVSERAASARGGEAQLWFGARRGEVQGCARIRAQRTALWIFLRHVLPARLWRRRGHAHQRGRPQSPRLRRISAEAPRDPLRWPR